MIRLPASVVAALLRRACALMLSRAPDFVIGDPTSPYMHRWFVIPRNRFFNVYVHLFLRSDDDRAHHDHPWLNCSIPLCGENTEHTIAAGGIHVRRVRRPGDIVFRRARAAHRIELHAGSCMTLFITGPRVRAWGFHCPEQGWVPWQRFTQPDNSGAIGPGSDA